MIAQLPSTINQACVVAGPWEFRKAARFLSGARLDSNGFTPPTVSSATRNTNKVPGKGTIIWNTTSKLLEFYDGTNWKTFVGIPVGGAASDVNDHAVVISGTKIEDGTISATKLNFTVADPEVDGDNVIATINASAETSGGFALRINAAKIKIGGDCEFTSGYDPTGKITATYGAADINANTTKINGGKILISGTTTLDDWRMTDHLTYINGGNIYTGTVTTAHLNFTPVQSTDVVAKINATAEGITINANRLKINGDCDFTAGYNPTGKIAAGGAAADVNANATTISGGKITTGSIEATQIKAGTITTTELNFTPATSTNVIAKINASAEGIRIAGNRIAINGDVTFSEGLDPGQKIANGGAAADVNANTTTISGGKITAETIYGSRFVANIEITSPIITGGTLRTASSGERFVITGSSATQYDSSGNTVFYTWSSGYTGIKNLTCETIRGCNSITFVGPSGTDYSIAYGSAENIALHGYHVYANTDIIIGTTSLTEAQLQTIKTHCEV